MYILTFTNSNKRSTRGTQQRTSGLVSEAFVKVGSKFLRHGIQHDGLSSKLVNSLEDFVRRTESDSGEETDRLLPDALGGRASEDGGV